MKRFAFLILAIWSGAAAALNADDNNAPHPYRLPSVDIKERVIWGSTCEAPDGTALSFGGEDRDSDDGLAHTRLRVDGKWIELRDSFAKDPRQAVRDRIWALRDKQKDLLAQARTLYFNGATDGRPAALKVEAAVAVEEGQLSKCVDTLSAEADRAAANVNELNGAWPIMAQLLNGPHVVVSEAAATLKSKGVTPYALPPMRDAQVQLEVVADAMSAEPPARALSPIVYEPKSTLFVLFGGDHCDYLVNDTWVFDPTSRKWSLRLPASAPPPRANHFWKATGDGKLVLTGGYTYFSNTDYMGGQYVDLNDGEWTYDVAENKWIGTGKAAPATSRTYRTAPFLPEYFYDRFRPDAAEFQTWLKALPANAWMMTNPPRLPKMNRDWGSAVIDPDRDLILRWSGGHCAHGGSDVLQYHMATNRWELCYPVEFPLGQLYTNTEYPGGFNFNRRPWISGHTYQNYGVDPLLKKMIFLGHSPWGYVYDPDQGDWTGRHALPQEMNYNASFFTLTTTPTPKGLVCWTESGDVLRFNAAANQWKPIKTSGERLPGAVVDNSTVAYDSHRDRLLFVRKVYDEKVRFDGEIYALDLKSAVVSRLAPSGKQGAAAIPYLCQLRYDPDDDLLLVGATLPPGDDHLRRTPAYDCATNEWISLEVTGQDLSGPKGRNVSLGLMYDTKRRLFWAVDTDSQVYVLRLAPAQASPQRL